MTRSLSVTMQPPESPSTDWRVARSLTAMKAVIDAAIIAASVLAAYVLRFERLPDEPFAGQMAIVVPAVVVLRLGAQRLFGVYRSSWRLFGLPDATVLAASVSAVTLFLIGLRLVHPYVLPAVTVIPFGVIALEAMATAVGLTGGRIVIRVWDEHRSRQARRGSVQGQAQRALLVGAGRAGRLAAKELRDHPDSGYEVVGFLDDDPRVRGKTIGGVPVLGTTHEVGAVVAEVGAEILIMTMPSAAPAAVRAIVKRCQEATELPVHTVPGMWELLSRRVEITKIRPVSVPDLLGRDVIDFCARSWSRVLGVYQGKCVLVTGAGGSIGSELCRQIAALQPSRLILLEANENNLFEIDNEIRALLGDRTVAALADIRDRARLIRVFERYRPEVVFHAAAFKHVPMMELHPEAAIDNNVRGTRVLTEVAEATGVDRFLLISTDKAVNPSSVMGASKRMAEMVVQARAGRSATRFCVVRFGNVLGSRGSVVHTFRRQIESGGPVTLTHPDVTRFFMTIPEAVRLVVQAVAISEGGELFLLEMGEPIRIMDLATQMIRLAGLSLDEIPIEIVGLRPGEKLHEELLRDDEGARDSGVQGVMLARPAPVQARIVWHAVAQLEAAAARGDRGAVVELLAAATRGRLGGTTALELAG